jgi:hypothetical protein
MRRSYDTQRARVRAGARRRAECLDRSCAARSTAPVAREPTPTDRDDQPPNGGTIQCSTSRDSQCTAGHLRTPTFRAKACASPQRPLAVSRRQRRSRSLRSSGLEHVRYGLLPVDNKTPVNSPAPATRRSSSAAKRADLVWMVGTRLDERRGEGPPRRRCRLARQSATACVTGNVPGRSDTRPRAVAGVSCSSSLGDRPALGRPARLRRAGSPASLLRTPSEPSSMKSCTASRARIAACLGSSRRA